MTKNSSLAEITNIKERRPELLKQYVEAIAVPYNQYINKYNTDILKTLIRPLFNASLIGYEYQDDWENQDGQEKDDSIERVFKIKRTFNGITLTDEEFDKVANFAQAIRLINTNNLVEIVEVIEKYATDEFAVFSSAREVLYILYIEENVVEALIYYKLIPTNVMSRTTLLRIPPEYKGKKLYTWGVVPEGYTEYYMPAVCSGWLYTDNDGNLCNPLWILPEWFYSLGDS